MPEIQINYLAVLVAAIVGMVIGFIWYGPLFGRQWMTYLGIDPASLPRGGMTRIYVWQLILALVTAYVLARLVDVMGASTIGGGIVAGFWIWLGFVATQTATGVLYERRPLGLWVLNNAYHLINLAVMGALLAVWV